MIIYTTILKTNYLIGFGIFQYSEFQYVLSSSFRTSQFDKLESETSVHTCYLYFYVTVFLTLILYSFKMSITTIEKAIY